MQSTASTIVDSEERLFSVRLGSSRIIYKPDTISATLTVSNPQDYPILVQSIVIAENKKDQAPFIVTPPLFRLDGGQTNQIKIIQTDNKWPSNRETLQWVCVTGIPPKNGDVWNSEKLSKRNATLDISYRVQNCIKMFVRPPSLENTPEETASQLEWFNENGHLKVINPTPYYMTLKDVHIGNNTFNNLGYISPGETKTYKIPSGNKKKVQWRIVTDYGGNSKLINKDIK